MLHRRKPTSRGKASDQILTSYNTFLRSSKLDENGNPYFETISEPRRADWTLSVSQRLYRKNISLDDIDRRRKGGKKGAPSLGFLVRSFLNGALEGITVEACEGVPWRVMKPVWEDALRTGHDSFRVWSTFAFVYGDEPDFKCHEINECDHRETRWRTEELSPTEPKLELFALLASPAMIKWPLHLDLRFSKGITRLDLLELSNIPTLKTLFISRHYREDGDTNAEVDDGIIRAWSRAASRERKFQNLQKLMLTEQPHVTEHSFAYFKEFPALKLVLLNGTGVRKRDLPVALENGWKVSEETEYVEDLNKTPHRRNRIELSIIFGLKASASGEIPPCPADLLFCRILESKRRTIGNGTLPSLQQTQAKKPRTVRNSKRMDLFGDFGIGSSSGAAAAGGGSGKPSKSKA